MSDDKRLTHDPRLWRTVVLIGAGVLRWVTATLMVLLGRRAPKQLLTAAHADEAGS